MNGKQSKKIRQWCTKVWDTTPTEERIGFTDFNHFYNRIKSQFKEDKEFQLFIKMTLDKGYVI